jgi:hypothetical protein
VDELEISNLLVYHHKEVAKILIFLRDKTKKNLSIDWDSVKNEMRPYIIGGNQWEYVTK